MLIGNVNGATYYSRVTGNFATLATWSTSPTGSPTNTTALAATDVFIIQNGHTITVAATQTVASVTFTGASATLTVNATFTLTVSGAVILNSITTGNTACSITGAGTLSCGSVTVGSGGGGTANRTTTLTSTITALTVSGNITLNSSFVTYRNNSAFTHTSGTVTTAEITTVTPTGSTSAYSMGATSPTLFLTGATPWTIGAGGTNTITLTGTGATVNYNGTNQTIGDYSYRNLTISGSGTKTWTFAGNRTISGNLTVSSGTLTTVGNLTLGVTGTTSVTGTLNLGGTSAKTFTGNVTINYGGIWNETGVAAINFAGNLQNDGSFTANTGVHTFTGTAKTISGANSIAIPYLTISGTTSNTGTLTVSTALAGTTGTLANSGTLNIGGTCSIGTTSGGLYNSGTINRTGAGTTTTLLAGFTNTGIINLGGSGSITGITNNAGGIVNLNSSGTITSFNNATSTSVLNITALTVPAFTTLTVSAAGNTINYNGAGTQAVKAVAYSNLILSGGGDKTIASGTSITGNIGIAPTGSATASIGAGLSINAGSLSLAGAGTVSGSWGSSSSSATNQNNTYFAATTGLINVSTNICAVLIAPTTTGAQVCVGTTATLSASGATSGQLFKWYSAESGGTLLKTSTDNTDNSYTTPVLSATTSYWISIQNPATRCESARAQVTATFPAVSADDRNRTGTDTWIGHVFKRLDSSPGAPSDANAFTNYYGTITEPETFNESFVGTNSCLPLTATESARSIYTEYFATRFRMNSSKTGVYLADIGSDDGARLTVDGALVYNQWVERGYVTDALVLFTLTGTSNLLLEYYESMGGNQVSFQNLVKVPNNLTSGTNQTICAATPGSQISANNAFTNSPISGNAAFTVTYQWQQATNIAGPWSDIPGATFQDFTPPGLTAGSHYFRRKLTVSRTNPGTISVSAVDYSDIATVTVNPPPATGEIIPD